MPCLFSLIAVQAQFQYDVRSQAQYDTQHGTGDISLSCQEKAEVLEEFCEDASWVTLFIAWIIKEGRLGIHFFHLDESERRHGLEDYPWGTKLCKELAACFGEGVLSSECCDLIDRIYKKAMLASTKRNSEWATPLPYICLIKGINDSIHANCLCLTLKWSVVSHFSVYLSYPCVWECMKKWHSYRILPCIWRFTSNHYCLWDFSWRVGYYPQSQASRSGVRITSRVSGAVKPQEPTNLALLCN